jgi:transcriptional regulator
MYLPKHFEVTSVPTMHSFIEQNPFGTLVCQTSLGMVANHIPFELDVVSGDHGVLRAHVARANPIWQQAASGVEVLVIFQGIDSYITPSWYPTKKIAGKAVPTWAYAITHAYGEVKFIQDAAWLHGLVSRLSNTQEADRPEPWSVSDAPSDYVDKLLGAIVGVEIKITRLEGKWKVDQNKQAVDRAGVAAGLKAQGDKKSLVLAELVSAKS